MTTSILPLLFLLLLAGVQGQGYGQWNRQTRTRSFSQQPRYSYERSSRRIGGVRGDKADANNVAISFRVIKKCIFDFFSTLIPS